MWFEEYEHLINKIKMIAPDLDVSKLSLRKLEIVHEILLSGMNPRIIKDNIHQLDGLYVLYLVSIDISKLRNIIENASDSNMTALEKIEEYING